MLNLQTGKNNTRKKNHNKHFCVWHKNGKKEITQLTSKEIKEVFTEKKKTTPSAKIKYNQEFNIDEKIGKTYFYYPKNCSLTIRYIKHNSVYFTCIYQLINFDI